MPYDKATKTLQDEQTNTTSIPKIDTNIDTTVSLDDISQYLKLILKELQSHDDEGDYIFQQGVATTDTSLNIIDLLGILGYPVKGYVITNDGGNTIKAAHNLTPSIIDSNLQTTATTKFYTIYKSETHKEMFNRKVIRNIYIRTDVGISAYRMWLLW
jgi:hypothetical protein